MSKSEKKVLSEFFNRVFIGGAQHGDETEDGCDNNIAEVCGAEPVEVPAYSEDNTITSIYFTPPNRKYAGWWVIPGGGTGFCTFYKPFWLYRITTKLLLGWTWEKNND